MHRLRNPVRPYAWGSRTHIPRLLGEAPTDRPVAEMWLGAHPGDPSYVDEPGGPSLLAAVEADPEGLLGERVAAAFGGRLPFLVKLLAAAEPLSLQVHPSSERARIRHAEQEAAGIPLDAALRTYQDASHKPEMIYALTRFEGMAGFRDPRATAMILRGLELAWLDEVADVLDKSGTPFQTLREVVTGWLALDGDDVAVRLAELRAAAGAAEDRAHARPRLARPPQVGPDDVARESVRVYAATVPLVDRYPRDPGVLVTLLLNHVVLAPGEAMFIDAGIVHAYTSGFGVEVMASSDNVLRAGLTPKHVDVAEMLETTNFTPVPAPLWEGRPHPDGSGLLFAPPVEEFELRVCELGELPLALEGSSPRILLCLAGSAAVASGERVLEVAAGGSVFVPAGEDVDLTGDGRLAVVRTAAHLAVVVP